MIENKIDQKLSVLQDNNQVEKKLAEMQKVLSSTLKSFEIGQN